MKCIALTVLALVTFALLASAAMANPNVMHRSSNGTAAAQSATPTGTGQTVHHSPRYLVNHPNGENQNCNSAPADNTGTGTKHHHHHHHHHHGGDQSTSAK